MFIFQYPVWFVLICLVVAFSISAILYYRKNKDDFGRATKIVLAVIRFVVVFTICFLLMSPIFEQKSEFTEDPIVIFIQDNSHSIEIVNGDKNKKYLEERKEFLQELRKDFEIRDYLFGEKFREADNIDFSDRFTDISSVFSGLRDLYSNRNVGAVIIATDGIYNRGANPIYAAAEMPMPVYTIAMGDTLVRRDVIINRINHNEISYLGNFFPVEIVVEARKAKGLSSKLTVSSDDEILYSNVIDFKSDHDFITELIQLEATEVGMKKYTVSIEQVDGEVNLENNHGSFFIDVIDSRQKILILADSPHPDIGAIKISLEDNENYEVDYKDVSEFDGQLEIYDLVVLHQLPSRRNPNHQIINKVLDSKSPALFVIGANSNLTMFNNLSTGLEIRPRSSEFNNSHAAANNNFSLFSMNDEEFRLLEQMPPLYAPFASYHLTSASQIFAYQRIGNVSTNDPLIVFTEIASRKFGFICGEGIWRWRLHNYMRKNNHYFFNDFISKIVQYLSIIEDRSLFRVNTKNLIYETDPLIFNAELYNASYELINEPDVTLKLTNEEGASFSYVFNRTANAYTLNAGNFPPGEYKYTARAEVAGENFESNGIISVAPLDLEALNTLADHRLLYAIADGTGAKMYYTNQLDELSQEIKDRDDIAGIIYSQKEYSELINWRWIFFFILVLLSVEWFVRKRAGGY